MACAGSVVSGSIQVRREEEITMTAASISTKPTRPDGHLNLYATSGAMFLGLLGVFLFAAPGGSIGALLGALAGAALARTRSSVP